MPRTAETPGKPARNRIQVLLTDEAVAALDIRRGSASQSGYVRGVLENHLGVHERTHAFKRGELIAERTVKGINTKTYKCAHPGCTDTRET